MTVAIISMRLSLAIVCCTVITLPAVADSMRQHDSHEHGTARLDIAAEGDVLQIRLDSPAANIIGFEHAPRDSKQKRTLTDAIDLLNNGNELFITNEDAACRDQIHAEVVSPFDKHDHHQNHSLHDHADETSHADIVSSWRFKCERADAIRKVHTRLFQHFPQLKRLQVQYITSDKQGGTMLTLEKPFVSF